MFWRRKVKITPEQNISQLINLINEYHAFALIFHRDENYKYSFEKIANKYREYVDNFTKLYSIKKDNTILIKIKFEKISVIFLGNLLNLVTMTGLKPKKTYFTNKNVKYLVNILNNTYGAIL
jgi:hypothetical protein